LSSGTQKPVGTAPPRAKGDFDRLLKLFVEAHPHRGSHWNPLTGEIFAGQPGRRGQLAKEAFELRLLEEDGWIEIPWQESDDAYGQARQWLGKLKPGKGRAELARALDTPKPFRAFRTVLAKHPGLARRWQEESTAEALARMVECLVAHEATLSDQRFVEAWRAWEAAQACSTPPVFAEAAQVPVRVSLGILSLGKRVEATPEPAGPLAPEAT
jgi:hypothetical protein